MIDRAVLRQWDSVDYSLLEDVLTRWWLRGVGDVFEGDVVLAEDGMRFDLAPREGQGL